MIKIDQALLLIRKLQPVVMEAGYYLALAGGVLNNGRSPNDLDLVAVPRTEHSTLQDLILALGTSLTWAMKPYSDVPCAKVTYWKHAIGDVEVICITHHLHQEENTNEHR